MIRRASLLITILIFSIPPGAKASLTFVDLSILNQYAQSSSGLTSFSGYHADFDAFLQSASDFNGGTVTYSGPGVPGPYLPVTLVQDASDPLFLVQATSEGFPTVAALNAAFPFGTYTVAATNSVTSATESATISYAQNFIPSVPPQLTQASYAGLQGLNAGSAFDLQFNSFTPSPSAPASDTFLFIFGPAGATVLSQTLSSSATDFVLPAKTLAAGTNYTVRIGFEEGGVAGPLATNYFDLITDASFTTAAGATPPQTLVDVPGGSLSAPVLLPPGPVQSVSSPIGGDGASDFYELYWPGGAFDANASIAGANPNGSYDYELFNPDGTLNIDLILDAADGFSATINETILEGLYEIGIVADSPFDPEFTIDFATPVEGVSPSSVPEPSTFPLLASGLVTLFFVVRRQRRT